MIKTNIFILNDSIHVVVLHFSTFSCFNHIPGMICLLFMRVMSSAAVDHPHSYFQTVTSASHLLSLALQVSGIHYCRLNRSQMGY